jgi:hypothetical protein
MMNITVEYENKLRVSIELLKISRQEKVIIDDLTLNHRTFSNDVCTTRDRAPSSLGSMTRHFFPLM